MNKYAEEFKEIVLRIASNHPKHGRMLCVMMDELQELMNFVEKIGEKAQMYDDLCN